MTSSHHQETIRRELRQAKSAHMSGNVGLARVCARRAAGIAIGKYLADNELPDPSPSAFDRLKYIETLPEIPKNVRNSVNYLTERVNENFELSSKADLIVEAQNLINTLLPGLLGKED
jgi:hypothetical protein